MRAVDSGKCICDIKAKGSKGVLCVGGGGLDDVDSDLGPAGRFAELAVLLE